MDARLLGFAKHYHKGNFLLKGSALCRLPRLRFTPRLMVSPAFGGRYAEKKNRKYSRCTTDECNTGVVVHHYETHAQEQSPLR